MKKLVLLFLFTALTAAGLLPQSASAQVERGSETVYIRPQVGISYYMGDNEKSPFNFDGDMFDTFPYNLGAELGYQFTPSYSLGLRFTTGQYTQITDFEATTDATDHPNSRWSVGLVARKLLSDKKIAPYWFAGVGIGGGTSNVYSPTCAAGTGTGCVEQDEMTYGASLGFGLDFFVNSGTSFFLQTGVNAMTPDDAADGRDDNGFSGLDFLGAHVVGLKFNFKRVQPVELTDMICPADVVDAGTPVTFTASHNDNATMPVDYLWTFGDGSSAEGMTATHTFTRAGDYTVGVSASNGSGKYSSAMTCAVSVKDPCLPAAITSMRASNMSPDTQTAVEFSANVTGTDGEWRWDFGDGSTGTGASATHTYSEAGTYTVTLEVENCNGVTSRTMTITVVPYEAAICRELTEMNSAFFDRNSSAITEEGRAQLQENLEILLECPNLNVRVEGWSAPGERRPQELSDDRARAVEQFYVDNGVSASRIVSTGMGRSESGSKKEGLAQFRRVDTIPVR
ncbi:MAG: PKD domain-containing protein [Bacteroidetes bacterium]|nr:PKD domain-containing protein [Bacteroidota bacterium]